MSDQQYLGDVITEPHYRVFDLGPYPGLVADAEKGLAVQGELFAVNDRCLAELDEFEEVPTWFKREPIAIAGRQDVVFAYYMSTPAPTDKASGDRWPLIG